MVRFTRLLLAFVLSFTPLLSQGQTTATLSPGPSAVPAIRLERLAHGINLSHWMAQDYLTPEHIKTYFTEDDARLIHGMGFRHVRLTLNPQPLWNADDSSKLNPERLAMLDHGIDFLLAADLAVIVDLHPEEDFKKRLAEEPGFPDQFAQFWKALAGHMAARDPDRLYFEVLNEPQHPKGAQWEAIQAQAVAAIRAAAPNHTIIATGGEWGGADTLLKIKPLADRNIVYNFHYYNPMAFTHQGATWGMAEWKWTRDVPYPSDAAAIEKILSGIKDEKARQFIKWFGRETWNRAKIHEQISRVAGWAKANQVPVTCNEFGVYALRAPREARLAWLRDVREELESNNIGWCMWDYSAGFEVVVKKEGKRTPDDGVLQSLGLKK